MQLNLLVTEDLSWFVNSLIGDVIAVGINKDNYDETYIILEEPEDSEFFPEWLASCTRTLNHHGLIVTNTLYDTQNDNFLLIARNTKWLNMKFGSIIGDN